MLDAIESGVDDLNNEALKERIAALKAIRDQAKADAERAQAALDSIGNQAVSLDMVETFARAARQPYAVGKLRLPPRSPTRTGSACRSCRRRGAYHGIEVGTAANSCCRF